MSLPHDQAARDAVEGTHVPTCEARIRTPDGTSFQDLPIRSGVIRMTTGTYPSITATLDLADLDSEFLQPGEPVTPYGNRVKIRSILETLDGDTLGDWLVANLLITEIRETVPGRTYTLTCASDEVFAAGKVFRLPRPVSAISTPPDTDPAPSPAPPGWSSDPYWQMDLPPIMAGDESWVRVNPKIITTPPVGGDGVVRVQPQWYWNNCLPTDTAAITYTVNAATGGGSWTVTGTNWGNNFPLHDWTVTGFQSVTFMGATYTPPTAGGGGGGTTTVPPVSAWTQFLQLVAEAMPSSRVIVDQAIVDVGIAGHTVWTGTYLSCMQTCLDALGAEMTLDVNRDIHLWPVGGHNTDDITNLWLYGSNGTIASYEGTHTRAVNEAVMTGLDSDNNTIAGAAVSGSPYLSNNAYGTQAWQDTYPITTDETTLTSLAADQLRRLSRRSRTVTIAQPAMPWLEPGDRVDLHYTDTHSEPFTIRSIELPLGPGLQRLELVSRSDL